MENSNLENARAQLAGFLTELREKRANPFKGTALEALTGEIREMRKTHGLSYGEIAGKLKTLKIETSEGEVGDFCRQILKGRTRRREDPRRSPPAR